ncbi:tetratricopeptide repeat protein [Sporomusa sp. KB1]|jgi:tetratricopeptide (TPR) repeat protein|uniref:tetratricopeptide repeat protein n=1 Tax=Sporomusa sp. KB1 TaxID=943346 RepID=UPI00119D3992|nr:tetratricopeptide repeat protein [Sporomusa sp. KB1]TWH47593.1 tetratricopeptide (TPR) repeat protein [Sporomusa sp. KB1]
MSENQAGMQQQLPVQADLDQADAQTHYKLGCTLQEQGRLTDALTSFCYALALNPDYSQALCNLGVILHKLGRSGEAIQCFQKALALEPDSANSAKAILWYNLGSILLEVPRLPEAVAALRQAITLQPDLAEAYTHLGNGLLMLQRPSEAVAVLQQAIALKPDFAGAYNNLGNALQAQGKAADAIAAYNRASALNPADPDVYNNRAQAILLSGNLARGFAEYEWRTKLNWLRHFYEWFEDKPRWQGENFAGKRLLVYDEQGCGDAIQFSRYLPLVKARGGIVQFSTKQPLLRLFAKFIGIDELVEHNEAAIVRTESDLTVPLMSLPHIFGTTLPTIPANIPYLAADQNCVAAWSAKMNSPAANLRVGLVWAGNPANISGQIRTCGLQAMSPLACIPGVTFYSLQKGEAGQEAHTPPSGMRLIDLTDAIDDFADSAALIMNLDLVISVDTAVAHLAGALGKPVWTLLPAAGEWRWLLDRSDTPWYPTMRLFRQRAPGDWGGVMTTVTQELRKWKEM